MKKFIFFFQIFLILFFPFAGYSQHPAEQWFQGIEERTGAKGKWDPKEDVFKVSFPRSDLKIQVAGSPLPTGMGLTVWAAFKNLGDHAMVMGDLVLLEDQVNPVMDIALANGLEVTALHNHFFWDSPKVMFMHISGSGQVSNLAQAVGKVFASIRETMANKPEIPAAVLDPSKTSFNTKNLEEILGAKGELKDGVYKVTIGRTTQMAEHEMGNTMGVNTWAAFVGTDQQAVVDGDFAMLESELQAVLKALRAAGIYILAIHQHMTMENPRILFLHYWGTGPAENLARGLKSALDSQR